MRSSFAVAPPSTRSSVSVRPASFSMATRTSALWKAIDSRTARARWPPVEPRVSPKMAPRAYASQCGAPSPAKAGTK